MITLYGFGPYFGLPDASPFVMKTEVQLKMAGLAHSREIGDLGTAPKGKLPYIVDGNDIVSDTTFIRAHIETRYGVDFDRNLDQSSRASAWAIERMLEERLYWAMVYFRWFIPENFAKGPAHYVDSAPEDIRARLREERYAKVTTYMHAVGIGRHSPAEIVVLAERDIAATSVLLGDSAYMMGDKVSGVDAIAFAMLAGVMTPFFDTPLRASAERLPNLEPYIRRMMSEFYPVEPN